MKAIILAAGYATRMYPLTKNQPKALLPLGGRVIVDYIVQQLNTLPGLSEIILVSNQKFFSQFENWLSTANKTPTYIQVPISLLNNGSVSEEDKLGAIGDIYFALQAKQIAEDVVIMAGDNYLDYPLLEQYEFFQQKQADTLNAMEINDTAQLQQFAVAQLDEEGRVLTLVEKPMKPLSNTAIFATYFYRAQTLPLFDEYLNSGQNMDQPGRFPAWLHTRQPVYAYKMNGTCHDIGTIAAYEALKEKLG